MGKKLLNQLNKISEITLIFCPLYVEIIKKYVSIICVEIMHISLWFFI